MVKEKSENIDFLNDLTGQSLNHLVRQDGDKKGIVNIEVNTDGTYNVRLYRGTEDKPAVIEGIDKEQLLSQIEKKL